MVTNPGGQDISIRDRKVVQVTGVSSVESFDLTQFTLVTASGPLRIDGTGLRMKHLDLETGVVMIEGTVTGLTYVPGVPKKKRWVGRLVR